VALWRVSRRTCGIILGPKEITFWGLRITPEIPWNHILDIHLEILTTVSRWTGIELIKKADENYLWTISRKRIGPITTPYDGETCD